MIIDGIGKVTLSNDILRIQTISTNTEGQNIESGTLYIPKGSIEGFLNGLVNAVNDINAQLGDAIKEKQASNGSEEKKEKKEKEDSKK